MARKQKKVIIESGQDRRDTGYYSTPNFVSEYIFKRLYELKPTGTKVFDTCVGKGELSQPFVQNKMNVTGVDIIDHSCDKLSAFYCCDFVELYKGFKEGDSNSEINYESIDFFIANPPYNCHEVDYIKDNKANLKKLFDDVGVHNMYSMFVSAMIDMAPKGAFLGLITLDSFLTSKAHKDLRRKILNNCRVHDVILCPTDLFLEQGADVRTCILILEKDCQGNSELVRVMNRCDNKEEFENKLRTELTELQHIDSIILSNSIDNDEFLIGVPSDIKNIFNEKRISERFDCVTGISTGNDKKYIRSVPEEGFTVPFYKNPGSKKFYCKESGYIIDHFIEENNNVKNFMVRNIPLVFKPGITCSSMGVEFSACYLPANSTFGVNANIICDENDIGWLLAYLNSNLVKYIVRGVLIRTNMVTSGYVSRIPVPEFNSVQKNELSVMARKAYSESKKLGKPDGLTLNCINELVYNSCKISKNTQNKINHFCENIVKLT
ncbi:N-6 DNA methylase [Vibrio alginolyticus]|uniref:N-6 DNA methylase n=1 Tax=Vibrio alginolyticus TaxID=663 RepID=UPI001BD3D541|nr:N-6 DNA methylase [Vibrio alginolyticus]MBS9921626.1 N-6 DNA methylase [Vibrio alginolyticus]